MMTLRRLRKIWGLPVPKEEFNVPPPSAKRRRFGASTTVKERGKEKVSSYALTMTDLVGPRVEVHPDKEKSTSSESLSHNHDFITLLRYPEDTACSSIVQKDVMVSESGIDAKIYPILDNVESVLPESCAIVEKKIDLENPLKLKWKMPLCLMKLL